MPPAGAIEAGSKESSKVRVHLWDQMVLIGIGLAAFYTIFDSILYIFLSYNVDFLRRLFGPEISVIWTRLTILALLLLLGSHAQFTINQRKAAEGALRESEEKYRSIIETTEDGYYEVDTNGKLLFFNDALCNILGYTAEEILGKDSRIPLDPDSNRKVVHTFKKVFKTGQPVKSIDWGLICKDGTRLIVESSVSLLKDNQGQSVGFSGFLRDVTERKQAEVLQQAKLSAEAASRAKSEFLAKMSHEIRTPLNSIIGMVELMLDTDLEPQQHEDLDVVLSAAHALLSIINNVLDFSKIEAEKLDLEESNFDPREILEESLRIMAMRCHSKGLELICRIARDVPKKFFGDPARFRQVLLNLVDNAYKFTDFGEVVVKMDLDRRDETGGFLHVSVTDTGPGIAKDKQATIFKAFEQADAATSLRYGGAGLGLAVSDQLVRLMGGEMWVDSDTGKGCVFHFTCRFNELEDKPDAFSSLPDLTMEGEKVLVVDDNSTNCKVLLEMLESWRMKPIAALGVEEAKQAIHRNGLSSQPYRVALIDASLPDNGGYDLAQWIGQQKDIGVSVIAMLTYSQLQAKVDFTTLGVAAVLMKPIRSSELLRVITEIFDTAPAGMEKTGSLRGDQIAQLVQSLKILVAEDTPFNQKFIKRLLERWGHNAFIVENGRQVLKKLAEDNFDLILMDVQMPEMDGYDATRAIRKAETDQKKNIHIPIVAMTAHVIKGDRERCLEAGMDEYLSKPISSGKLLDILRRIASEKSDRQMSSTQEAEQPQEHGPALSIDRDEIKKAFDQDWDFFREVVDLFVTDYQQMVEDLRKSLAAGDFVSFSRNAHSIKGMVRLFKAEETALLAQELEMRGMSGHTTGLLHLVDELAGALDHLKMSLLRLSAERQTNKDG